MKNFIWNMLSPDQGMFNQVQTVKLKSTRGIGGFVKEFTRIATLFSIAFVLIFYSCEKPEDNFVPVSEEARSLTLIFYMAGDNNLNQETYQKIKAISESQIAGIAEGRANVLIYQDPSSSSGDVPKLWKMNGRGFEQPGSNSIKLNGVDVIETYPAENSASAEVLSRVIRKCMETAPADNYGLWIFSHGSGWLPAKTLNSPRDSESRSLMQDGREEMEIADFAAAIPDNVFEFIVFEMCFMSGVETTYELRNKAEYIVSSCAEIVSPGFTDIYSTVLPKLFTASFDTYYTLRSVANEFYSHWNSKSGWQQSATISIHKTAGMEKLATVTRKIISLGNEPENIDAIQHFDRYTYKLIFDFEDYMSSIGTDELISELKESLIDVVLYKASTDTFMYNYRGFSITKYCGLTSYIPQPEFPELNEAYSNLSWARNIGIKN